MGDLYEKYYKYIDWSVYEGLTDEEREKLEEDHIQKYGLNHILKEDAPPEAVKAWKEDALRSIKARKAGEIIN